MEYLIEKKTCHSFFHKTYMDFFFISQLCILFLFLYFLINWWCITINLIDFFFFFWEKKSNLIIFFLLMKAFKNLIKQNFLLRKENHLTMYTCCINYGFILFLHFKINLIDLIKINLFCNTLNHIRENLEKINETQSIWKKKCTHLFILLKGHPLRPFKSLIILLFLFH